MKPSGNAPARALAGRGIVERALDAAGLAPSARAAAGALWREDAVPDAAGWRDYLGRVRQAGLREAGFAVARSLCDAHPRAVWPLAELASFCGRETDRETALAIGLRLHEADPLHAIGARLVLQCLRALDRQSEMEAFFQTLPVVFARHAWFHKMAASLAQARGDGERALHHAAELRRIAPDRVAGFTLGCQALRRLARIGEAEQLAQVATRRFPGELEAWREAARTAEAEGGNQGWELASQRWAELRRRFPHSPIGYVAGINLLLRQEKARDADALLADGLAANPGCAEILALGPVVAARRIVLETPAETWRARIAANPRDPGLRIRAAQALLGSGEGRKLRLAASSAMLAEVTRDFPDHVPGCLAYANLLRDAGDHAAADEVVASWLKRFPYHPDLTTARARIMESRGDRDGALAYLAEMRLRPEINRALEAAYARLLSLCGEHAMAEEICSAGLAQRPADPALLLEYAQMALRRGDWAVAERRAQAGLLIRPDFRLLHNVRHAARVHAPDDVASEPESADIESGGAHLFARFESLGGTQAGCEFGIVQRKFDCETLGLLRWAKIDFDGLLAALDNEFEGVGAAENTVLSIRDGSVDNQEYYLTDRRLGFATHTFVNAKDITYERMLAQSLRRLAFLRRKLLEDLRGGEKIWAFKIGGRTELQEKLPLLHHALERYAACTLLCVAMADAENSAGTVKMLAPGLFLGFCGSFMETGPTSEEGIDLERWRLHCEHVAGWHDRRYGLA